MVRKSRKVAGYLFFETVLIEKEEQNICKIFNSISEFESTFGLLKNIFHLEPLCVVNNESSIMHLNVGFSAPFDIC